MRKLLIGALAATLVTSCASTSDVSDTEGTGLPAEAASVPGESPEALNNDPFLNSGAETDPAALATAPTEAPTAPPSDAPAAPVMPAPAETPASPVAEAPPVPVAPQQDLPKPVTDGDLASAAEQMKNNGEGGSGTTATETPPTTSESGTTAEAAPPAPGADTPPPYTQSTTLDSTTQANNEQPSSATPPPVMEAGGGDKRSYRQQYKEYAERQQTSAQEAEDYNKTADFAHEGGAWQIGLDYDLTGVTAPTTGVTGTISDTQTIGGALSWTYFPLRSIDTGRLGVGLRGGAYLSKYDTVNGTVKNTSPRKLSALTYGVRATYELDFWVAQLLVPFAFVGYDQVSTKAFSNAATAVNVPAQKFGSVNYGAGVNFNLNRLEPRAASKSLVSTGIRKFYLAYTFQQRSGELTGASHFLGLRFEY